VSGKDAGLVPARLSKPRLLTGKKYPLAFQNRVWGLRAGEKPLPSAALGAPAEGNADPSPSHPSGPLPRLIFVPERAAAVVVFNFQTKGIKLKIFPEMLPLASLSPGRLGTQPRRQKLTALCAHRLRRPSGSRARPRLVCFLKKRKKNPCRS